MNIVLIGFKNVGKTTIGKALAERLDYHFLDTDHMITDLYKNETGILLTSSEIYKKEGGSFFRTIETRVILGLNHIKNAIVSTGGGSILSGQNRDFLKTIGSVIHLRVSKNELLKRFENKINPMFLDKDNKEVTFDEMFEHRKPIYEMMADRVIDVDGKSIEEVVNDIGNHNGI